MLAGAHTAAVGQSQSSANTAGGAMGGLAVVALVVMLAFVAAIAGIVRRAAGILSQVLQMATTLGTAFFTMILVTGVAIALLLHG
jgi:hypothetical protein